MTMVPSLLIVILLYGVTCTGLPQPNLQARAAGAGHVNFQQRNLDTITKIYERTVYPTNLEFLANGSNSVPAGLFNENATGRISPAGNFTGFNESTEYFFALAPVPRPPNYTAFSKIQIVSFQSQCANVASSVVYFTSSVFNPNATNNGDFFSTLKQVRLAFPPAQPNHVDGILTLYLQVAFWEFDDSGAVLKYDAWIPNLGLYYQEGSPTPGGNVSSADIQAATIKSLCDSVQSECTGSNTQYNSTQGCIDTLSAKPFGSWEEVWMDSVVCRELHILIARVDPLVRTLNHFIPRLNRQTSALVKMNIRWLNVHFRITVRMWVRQEAASVPTSHMKKAISRAIRHCLESLGGKISSATLRPSIARSMIYDESGKTSSQALYILYSNFLVRLNAFSSVSFRNSAHTVPLENQLDAILFRRFYQNIPRVLRERGSALGVCRDLAYRLIRGRKWDILLFNNADQRGPDPTKKSKVNFFYDCSNYFMSSCVLSVTYSVP